MRECEAWRNSSDAEFDNAMEGMEKLVMNKLYELCVSTCRCQTWIRLTTSTQHVHSSGRTRCAATAYHTDDLERDRVLTQRIALFKWIEPKHLDIPEGEGSEGFLMFAQQGTTLCFFFMHTNSVSSTELLKINHYKAPRDKLICILNCCKVIFGPLLTSIAMTGD